MKKGIFLSIKPEFTKKIEIGEKNYEFRKYIPKEEFNILYVYETVPTCSLKYIITVDKVLEYPDRIPEKGYGNEDFNNGLKKSKYAYHILKVEKLDNPISLKELKSKFGFAAPQSYAYDTRYPELVDHINTLSKKMVINNEV
jgi:predicted transcriptional regulator